MAKKEITFEEICRDITARKFQPVYVLMGEEPFFIDQITDLLLKSVLEESERDFNQIILYGADTDAISIINGTSFSDDVRISIDSCSRGSISERYRVAEQLCEESFIINYFGHKLQI